MNTLIQKFDHSDHAFGLFLLDMPTGTGKSYSVFKYICTESLSQENNHKNYIFLTTLKKNLQVESIRKMFEENNQLEYFDKYFLFIDSNKDCILNNLTVDLINQIPIQIQNTKEFKNLDNCVRNIHKNTFNKEILDVYQQKLSDEYEPAFRKLLSRLLNKSYPKLKDRRYAVKNITEWKWVSQLYPAVLTHEKRIFFMSMDKFLLRNTPIIEKSYLFKNAPLLKNAIIFIDEFDATKETILKNMIHTGVSYKNDLLNLFYEIHSALQHKELPSILNGDHDQLKPLILDNEMEHLKKIADTLYESYHLQFSVRTQEENDQMSQQFIFHDYSYATIFKERHQQLALKVDTENKINHIYFKKDTHHDEENIYLLLSKIYGFIIAFHKKVDALANRYVKYKNNHSTYDGDYPKDAAIETILAEFRLSRTSILFLSNMILSRQKNKKEDKDIDLSFYESGFRYYSFINDIHHDMQSKVMISEFRNTPEKFILNLAQKTKVFGMSATANLPTNIGNYDLTYFKSKLRDAYCELSMEDDQLLQTQFNDQIEGYKDIEIHTKFIRGKSDSGYELNTWYKVFDDPEIAEETYHQLEILLSNDEGDFKKERYVRLALAYRNFIRTSTIQSFLCILCKHPKKSDPSLDIDFILAVFQAIADEASKSSNDHFDAKKSVFLLDGQQYHEKRNELTQRLENAEKTFVISVYQTVGAGQNLDYPIPSIYKNDLIEIYKYDTPSSRKDFDAIYLDCPTHLITNLNDEIKEDDFVRYLFSIEYLLAKGEISEEVSLQAIKNAFSKYIGDNKSTFVHANLIRESKSVKLLAIRILMQAMGRICRTNMKNKNIYIFADDKIKDYLDYPFPEGTRLNPEFKALLEAADKEVKEDDGFIQCTNLAETTANRSNQFIQKLLRNPWSTETMDLWKNIRDYVLKYPSLTHHECLYSHYQCFYIQQPQQLDRYFYQQSEDYYRNKISFTKDPKYPLEVSASSARLDALMKIDEIKTYFMEQRYATTIQKNDCLLTPACFNNIYKGALGEEVGKYLVEKYCHIKLSEINDPLCFELFDYHLVDQNIYFDFKHWHQSTHQNTEEQKKKIFQKLDMCDAKIAIIINLLASTHYKIQTYTQDDKKIIVIPSLVNEETLQINTQNFIEIRRIIDELSD